MITTIAVINRFLGVASDQQLPANAGDLTDLGWSLGGVGPLEEGMVTHSSILAWRIPWTEKPGRLWPVGSQRVRHDWSDSVTRQQFLVVNPSITACSHRFFFVLRTFRIYSLSKFQIHNTILKLEEVIEFQLSYSKSWRMMLWKCCSQYASKFGKLSSGHSTGNGPFSFQSQRKAMPKNTQATAQLQWHNGSESMKS